MRGAIMTPAAVPAALNAIARTVGPGNNRAAFKASSIGRSGFGAARANGRGGSLSCRADDGGCGAVRVVQALKKLCCVHRH
jgi:hypothetical protein